MDASGCPSGMATDRIFMVAGDTHCGSSLVLFWVLVIFYLIFRVLLTILDIRIALHVIKVRKEAKRSAKKERIPATTVLEIFYTIFSLIGWPLWGFNIANAQNGGGPALFILISSPYFISMFPSCLKLVHLGDRIIPKKTRSHISINSGRVRTEQLNTVRADSILLFLFILLGSCIVLEFLFQAILATTVHPGTSNIWNQLGMGMGGGVAISVGSIIIRQTFRVVNYIEKVHTQQMKMMNITRDDGTTVGVSGSSDEALVRTVRALKQRALAVGLSSSGCAVIFLCAAIIAMPWYLTYIVTIVGQIAAVGATFMYKPAAMSICCCSGSYSGTGIGTGTGDSKKTEPLPSPTTSNQIVNEPITRFTELKTSPIGQTDHSGLSGGKEKTLSVIPDEN